MSMKRTPDLKAITLNFEDSLREGRSRVHAVNKFWFGRTISEQQLELKLIVF
jgi:hypothetical protein